MFFLKKNPSNHYVGVNICFRTEKQSITERRASNVSPTREGRYIDMRNVLFISIFFGGK